MELILKVVEAACITLLVLIPAINMLVAQFDMSAGISPWNIRRGWWFAVLIPLLSGACYWLAFRPLLLAFNSGESSFSVSALLIGMGALVEVFYVVSWGLHSIGPTLLVFYVFQRFSNGQEWCVAKLQQEEEAMHQGLWPRRLFILQTIGFQLFVVSTLFMAVTTAILTRRIVSIE